MKTKADLSSQSVNFHQSHICQVGFARHSKPTIRKTKRAKFTTAHNFFRATRFDISCRYLCFVTEIRNKENMQTKNLAITRIYDGPFELTRTSAKMKIISEIFLERHGLAFHAAIFVLLQKLETKKICKRIIHIIFLERHGLAFHATIFQL